MSKEKQIVLTYAWGTPNAGDHALTLGAIELLLNHTKESNITIISRFSSENDPKDPTLDIKNRYPNIEVLESPFKFSRKTVIDRFFEKVYGLVMLLLVSFFPSLSLKLFRNNKALHSIANAKIVLCNGGNLFYWNRHRKSLPRLLALAMPMIMAKKLKVPYAFLPQTMGPIENTTLLNYTKELLTAAEFVMFRDNNSFNYMKNIIDVEKENIKLVPDLAFFVSQDYLNLQEEVNKKLENIGITKDDKFLTVTLRASQLGDPESVTGESVNKEAIENVTNYIKNLVIPVAKTKNLGILIVEQTDVDDETSHYFEQQCKEMTSNKISYISNRDPLFLSALYLRSECLVGMRLHSLIFALRVNKPAFAVYLKQFGPKTPGIYSSFELNDYCVDMEEINSKQASDKLLTMLNNYNIVEKQIKDTLDKELEKEKNMIKKYIY